jgi:gliding motility-associated-like protein
MKYQLSILIILLVLNIKAQEKLRGVNWSVGFAPTLLIQFDSSQIVSLDTLNNLGLTFGSSCISDTNGTLKIICNGHYILGKDGNWIENGDSINTPLGFKLFNYYKGDGFWNQMSIILPKKDNQYYVFTTGMSDAAYDDWKGTQTDFRFDVLSYHIVDMDANAGAGKVLSKNNILMKDARLSHNRMTAVRHANGRDWWLIKPHQTKQIFYTFRVTSDSIFGPFEQKSNFNMDTMFMQAGIYGLQGQLTASPDGNWIASSEAGYKGVFVYRFDRCSGQFSDYHFYQQASFDSAVFDYSVATCFSPNNKLLYLVTGENIWQCELEDTSKGSVQFITGRDTTFGFPEYNLSYLAPNGFIYIGAYHGIRNSMPFIENPDVRGLGCNFRGRGNGAFSQPYTNLNVPPNLPFYGLGKLEGSPCDTIKPYVEPPPITTSQILVPDAFSPNGDGKNDTWHILNLPQLQLSGINIQAVGVYNRWGNEVFKSSDINFAWDAKGWLSDTYYYYILYRNKAGTSQVQKGSVSVVR